MKKSLVIMSFFVIFWGCSKTQQDVQEKQVAKEGKAVASGVELKPTPKPLTIAEEKAALKLLGHFGGGEISSECTDFDEASKIQTTIQKLLKSNNPSERVHTIKFGDGCSWVQVVCATSNDPTIQEMQGILGSAHDTQSGVISTENGTTEVTWHKYGLINLAVSSDNQVSGLALVFKGGLKLENIR